jgi:hypothetical protein
MTHGGSSGGLASTGYQGRVCRTGDQRSTDPKYDKIEYAIRVRWVNADSLAWSYRYYRRRVMTPSTSEQRGQSKVQNMR